MTYEIKFSQEIIDALNKMPFEDQQMLIAKSVWTQLDSEGYFEPTKIEVSFPKDVEKALDLMDEDDRLEYIQNAVKKQLLEDRRIDDDDDDDWSIDPEDLIYPPTSRTYSRISFTGGTGISWTGGGGSDYSTSIGTGGNSDDAEKSWDDFVVDDPLSQIIDEAVDIANSTGIQQGEGKAEELLPYQKEWLKQQQKGDCVRLATPHELKRRDQYLSAKADTAFFDGLGGELIIDEFSSVSIGTGGNKEPVAPDEPPSPAVLSELIESGAVSIATQKEVDHFFDRRDQDGVDRPVMPSRLPYPYDYSPSPGVEKIDMTGVVPADQDLWEDRVSKKIQEDFSSCVPQIPWISFHDRMPPKSAEILLYEPRGKDEFYRLEDSDFLDETAEEIKENNGYTHWAFLTKPTTEVAPKDDDPVSQILDGVDWFNDAMQSMTKT